MGVRVRLELKPRKVGRIIDHFREVPPFGIDVDGTLLLAGEDRGRPYYKCGDGGLDLMLGLLAATEAVLAGEEGIVRSWLDDYRLVLTRRDDRVELREESAASHLQGDLFTAEAPLEAFVEEVIRAARDLNEFIGATTLHPDHEGKGEPELMKRLTSLEAAYRAFRAAENHGG